MKNTICILCKKESVLTVEHLFPNALGAEIKFKLLCKKCNSDLGTHIDANFVSEKLVELARTTYKIKGRAKSFPQAFSDLYPVDIENRASQVRIDREFKPILVGSAPTINMVSNSGFNFSLCVDESERNQIPRIIRKTLTKFFESEDGLALNWSQEQQNSRIEDAIEGAMNQPTQSNKISEMLQSTWTINLTNIALENLKIIYELGFIAYGDKFLTSRSARIMRIILRKRIKNGGLNWPDLQPCFRAANIMQIIPDPLSELFNLITKNERHTHLIALVHSNYIAVEMLGFCGSVYVDVAHEFNSQADSAMIYLVDIKNKKSTKELLANFLMLNQI